MKKMIILLAMTTMGVMAINAQSMAVEPKAMYAEPTVVLTEPHRAAEALRPAAPVEYKATRPTNSYSPLKDVNYSPQKLYAPSQQEGYASYGGGNIGFAPSNVTSVTSRVNGSIQGFHSTSILLPIGDKEEKQLAKNTTAEESLMQRVGWGPGPGDMPADPFLPVGNTPYLLLTLLAAIYIFFRK